MPKAGIEARPGRKWQAVEAVHQAESRLHQSKPVGVVTQGRAGLGSFSTSQNDTAKGKERNCLVRGEVRAAIEVMQNGGNGAAGHLDKVGQSAGVG